MLRDRIPHTRLEQFFLFIGLCACGIAVMRRRSAVKLLIWLGIWSAIEGTEYLFGSLADPDFCQIGFLPTLLPYVGNILSFSVVVIVVLAFMQLSRAN